MRCGTRELGDSIIHDLGGTQGTAGRHKCVVCAYFKGQEQGFMAESERLPANERCKHGNRAPQSILSELHTSQGKAGRHKCAVCAYALGLNETNGMRTVSEEDIAGIVSESVHTEPEALTGIEGGVNQRLVNTYERDPGLRAQAIHIHGVTCTVCQFNFESFYGERGRDYIEVHHLKQVSALAGPTEVDPSTDLTVVCSNCHRMIHRRRDSVLTPDELRALLRQHEQV